MRKNCRKVLTAWNAHKACRAAESIWTDGEHIYSYATCLVARAKGGATVLNRTRYSVTTTIHQNALAAWGGPFARTLDGLDREVSADKLLRTLD